MKLRSKVLTGFLILALMLSVAGVWSIGELMSIGTAVEDLLADNYRSIDASKAMLEALEREDSGILFLMLGKWEEGRTVIERADSQFVRNLTIASSNLTIPGEANYTNAIASEYARYKSIWERPIVDTPREGDLNWYFESVHPSFLEVKSAINDLMSLNDQAMYATASSLREKAKRAIMPGIVAIIAALAFSLMLSYFVNLFVVTPIVQITSSIRQSIDKKTKFNVSLNTRDELADLAESIRLLSDRAQQAAPRTGATQ